MEIKFSASDYDIKSILDAVQTDIHTGRTTVKGKDNKPVTKESVSLYENPGVGPTCLQVTLERMLHNAFKEGCKCGKGGFSPSY